MIFKADRFQRVAGILFTLGTLFTCTGRVNAGNPDPVLFFTPSVEPVGLESVQATPIPEIGKTDWNGGGLDLVPGDIIEDPAGLPSLACVMGKEEFGAATVSGSDDLMVIWITRDGKVQYQVVAVDNPALYGPRDPVTGGPLGFGFIDQLQDWEEIREQRMELIAGWVGITSSFSGSGASAAGGAAGSSAGGVGLILGVVDILGDVAEHYLNAGRTYFAMKASEQDLSNIFDEVQRHAAQ